MSADTSNSDRLERRPHTRRGGDVNRRRFLATSGTATVTALAGCLGVLEGDGDGSTSSEYDSVTRWTVPARGEATQSSGFSILTRSASTMLELDDDVSMDLQSALAGATSYVWGDVEPADLDQEIEIDPDGNPSTPYYRVFTGSFDVDAARNALADASEGEAGSYEGFDVYRGVVPDSSFGDTPRVYAVGDGAVVQSGGVLGNGGTVDQIHRVVDAVNGTTDRRTDQHEGLAEAASHMELGVTTVLETSDPDQQTDATMGRFRGVTAGGSYGTIDGGTIEMNVIYVFESADAVDTAAIEEYVSEENTNGQLNSASYDVEGRIVTITGSAEAEEFLNG